MSNALPYLVILVLVLTVLLPSFSGLNALSAEAERLSCKLETASRLAVNLHLYQLQKDAGTFLSLNEPAIAQHYLDLVYRIDSLRALGRPDSFIVARPELLGLPDPVRSLTWPDLTTDPTR